MNNEKSTPPWTLSALAMILILVSRQATLGAADGAAEPEPTGQARQVASGEVMVDKPLESYRVELLDTAFEAASAFPLVPHIKNMARDQERVVQACLELDQPRRALTYLVQIPNWRRGQAYAELGLYCAKQGWKDEAEKYLQLAEPISQAMEMTEERGNRIKLTMVEAYACLGLNQQADRVQGLMVGLHPLKAALMKTMRDSVLSASQKVAYLEGPLKSREYELILYAYDQLIVLYRQSYTDRELRSLIGRQVDDSMENLPPFARMKYLKQLARTAIDHADFSHAVEWLDKARKIIEGHQWEPDARIASLAKLSELRYAAKETDKASEGLNAAMAVFESAKADMQNFMRAGALRPIAEAYAAMGDSQHAWAIYEQAVGYGSENPNLRPRIDDLTANCVSMALHGIQPGTELQNRLRGLCDGVKQH